MLRITKVADSQTTITVKVEGEVVSDGSALLEEECLRCLAARNELIVDFKDVTLIDCRGVETLRALRAGNLKLINCSPLIEELIRGCEDR